MRLPERDRVSVTREKLKAEELNQIRIDRIEADSYAALLSDPVIPRIVLNLGGIGNLTLLPAGGAPVSGFDCGPGNVLLDAWIQRHQGLTYDQDGQWAASGQIQPQLLQALLSDPYFQTQGPKSTGREQFHLAWAESHMAEGQYALAARIGGPLLSAPATPSSEPLAAPLVGPADTQALRAGGS